MNIAERIEQMMKTKGINLRQLSIAANIPYTTLDGIRKRGDSNVKLNTLIKLADYFNVTLDYLVGREDALGLSLWAHQELKAYRDYLEWRTNYGQN